MYSKQNLLDSYLLSNFGVLFYQRKQDPVKLHVHAVGTPLSLQTTYCQKLVILAI